MRAGISYWAMEGGGENSLPIADAMLQAKSAGYDCIELAIAEQGVFSTASTQAECFAIRDLAQRHQLQLETVASGISWSVCPTHPNEEIRKKSLSLHHLALQRTAWVGAKAMLYVPGAITIPWDRNFPAVPYDSAVTWARKAVTLLAKTAEDHQIDLCVENVWNGLFYSPLEFSQFIDSIQSDRVGIYFDVGNVLGYHQHPQHWITLLGKRIRRIHVKDFKRAVGNLSGFCDLLEGDVEYAMVMQALRCISYDSTLIAEIGPPRPDLLTKNNHALKKILIMS